NTAQPLTWPDLQGRAVLLDFFTPGCINCVHMLPVEKQLTQRFGKRLVIIGVDTPKFTNSATQSGLETFLAVHDIRHPVVLDAHYRIWDAWQVFAWPTFFLVGPDGNVLGRFIGEQSFSDLAGPIAQALKNVPPTDTLAPLPTQVATSGARALAAPGGIIVFGDRGAISDTGHDRVVLTTTSGQVQAVFGKRCTETGGGQSLFSRPHGLTFHDGRLFVADTQGQRIRVIDPQAGTVTTLAGSGQRAYVA